MISVRENVSLKPYNTFGIEASARYFAEPSDMAELLDVLNGVKSGNLPLLITAGGSNMLYRSDFDGLVLRPVLKGIEVVDRTAEEVRVRASSGEDWDAFVAFCVQHQWGGLENLSLIPGHVGASPVQNIGAYGVEVKDCIDRVEVLSLDTLTPCVFSGKACGFGYRNSIFKQGGKGKYLVTSVVYKLFLNPVFKIGYGDLAQVVSSMGGPSLENVRNAVIDIRRRKLPDPAVIGNAGSFFKNPVVSSQVAAALKEQYALMPSYKISENKVKIPAAWLIEQSGWKGKALGRAGVHGVQPLVLVNLGGATGEDILRCAHAVRADVLQQFGINLDMEVQVVG